MDASLNHVASIRRGVDIKLCGGVLVITSMCKVEI
jgi:hypothetical protein